jgi:hypothetical protein
MTCYESGDVGLSGGVEPAAYNPLQGLLFMFVDVFFIFEVFVEWTVKAMTLLLRALSNAVRAVRDVRRTSQDLPKEKRRAVDYIDAVLFPEDGSTQ